MAEAEGHKAREIAVAQQETLSRAEQEFHESLQMIKVRICGIVRCAVHSALTFCFRVSCMLCVISSVPFAYLTTRFWSFSLFAGGVERGSTAAR